MKQILADVFEFHEKFGVPVADSPSLAKPDRCELRQRLHKEEFNELTAAIDRCAHLYAHPGDISRDVDALVHVADGIVDLMYVLAGTALEFGMQDRLDEVWRRVHAANLAKVGGGFRGDGKVLKPPGWTPPDVEGALWPK